MAAATSPVLSTEEIQLLRKVAQQEVQLPADARHRIIVIAHPGGIDKTEMTRERYLKEMDKEQLQRVAPYFIGKKLAKSHGTPNDDGSAFSKEPISIGAIKEVEIDTLGRLVMMAETDSTTEALFEISRIAVNAKPDVSVGLMQILNAENDSITWLPDHLALTTKGFYDGTRIMAIIPHNSKVGEARLMQYDDAPIDQTIYDMITRHAIDLKQNAFVSTVNASLSEDQNIKTVTIDNTEGETENAMVMEQEGTENASKPGDEQTQESDTSSQMVVEANTAINTSDETLLKPSPEDEILNSCPASEIIPSSPLIDRLPTNFVPVTSASGSNESGSNLSVVVGFSSQHQSTHLLKQQVAVKNAQLRLLSTIAIPVLCSKSTHVCKTTSTPSIVPDLRSLFSSPPQSRTTSTVSIPSSSTRLVMASQASSTQVAPAATGAPAEAGPAATAPTEALAPVEGVQTMLPPQEEVLPYSDEEIARGFESPLDPARLIMTVAKAREEKNQFAQQNQELAQLIEKNQMAVRDQESEVLRDFVTRMAASLSEDQRVQHHLTEPEIAAGVAHISQVPEARSLTQAIAAFARSAQEQLSTLPNAAATEFNNQQRLSMAAERLRATTVSSAKMQPPLACNTMAGKATGSSLGQTLVQQFSRSYHSFAPPSMSSGSSSSSSSASSSNNEGVTFGGYGIRFWDDKGGLARDDYQPAMDMSRFF